MAAAARFAAAGMMAAAGMLAAAARFAAALAAADGAGGQTFFEPLDTETEFLDLGHGKSSFHKVGESCY